MMSAGPGVKRSRVVAYREMLEEIAASSND
jgi:hypothetical protein